MDSNGMSFRMAHYFRRRSFQHRLKTKKSFMCRNYRRFLALMIKETVQVQFNVLFTVKRFAIVLAYPKTVYLSSGLYKFQEVRLTDERFGFHAFRVEELS